IRVRADKKARTVTIEDMGVGMNREDLIKNLGTIAQSGTKKFLESLKVKPGESNMIGQFGVGFYSAFLVADKVSVVTKAVNGEQLRWESNDDKSGSYSIEQDASDPIEGSSGTRVVLTLKEDAEEYLDEYKLRSLLGTYSEFISFPVELW
ncbi:histidine kinase-like ATPase, partial [Pavlovales sp. CCMP2436]